MSIQVTASHSDLNVSKVFKSHSRSSVLCVAPPDICILRTKTLKLTINGAPIYQRRILPDSYLRSRYQRCPPVCFFGGKGRPENGDEASPRKSIEKGFGNLKKEQSVEDALRQQIEKQEYYDDGGSDGNRSGGGGGRGDGGRGSSGGGSGGSGDESFHEFWDEQLQVILAAVGLKFVYEYLLRGEIWPYLARDYIKALFGKGKSYRVRENMEWLANYYQELVKYWSDLLFRPPFILSFKRLARQIAETETWWDVPFLYKSFMPEFYTQFLSPQKVKTRRKSIKDEDDVRTNFFDDSDKEVDGAESEDEVELKRRISGDEYSDFEKEVEMENSKEEEEEDSDPFESYLIDDYEDDGKEEEEKDFLYYVDKIDMAKAATLASDSEEEEEEEEEDDDVDAGYPEDYLSFLFGPTDYVEGPVRLAPKKKKKKKKKDKKGNGKVGRG